MKKAGKTIKLKNLCRITSGKLKGDGNTGIKGINTLDRAEEGDLSFFSVPRYKSLLEKTKASCVIVPKGFKKKIPCAVIEVDNVQLAFVAAAEAVCGKKNHPVSSISKKSSIASSAKLSKGVKVGDFSVIEAGAVIGAGTVIYPQVYIGRGSSVGKNCIIYPGAVLMDSVKTGDEVIIHSGAVIGSDGFGYAVSEGEYIKASQYGAVKIGRRVEIGANTTIDRGSAADTEIGDGTKIDNLVQIAHNVKIGKNCIIVSQAGIAGSTVVEDEAVLAGQAGVVGHIKIGKGARVGAQAGVTRDVRKGALVSGYPATEHRKARRLNALVKKLPELYSRVEKLAKEIEQGKE